MRCTVRVASVGRGWLQQAGREGDEGFVKDVPWSMQTLLDDPVQSLQFIQAVCTPLL